MQEPKPMVSMIENISELVKQLEEDEYLRFRMRILMCSNVHEFKREFTHEKL